MISKKEQKARNIAIWVIGSMIVIWIVLGIFSFRDTDTRKRPKTPEISFNGQTALRGKQVFQAYNGMDCHTIVGNGGYFAPDLTRIYKETGPAWLRAYLSSPGSYPTKAIVNIQLQKMAEDKEVDVSDLDAYYKEFPAAQKRIERRGGIDALMPNLAFSADEIDALIAFFKYTSMLNTEGWPPEVKAKPSIVEQERKKLEEKSGIFIDETSASPKETNHVVNGTNAVAASGLQIATELGCMACHSSDGSTKIGPSWKGLFGSSVTLDNGKTIQADTAYLRQSVLEPDAEVVKGFQKGVMPSYKGSITDEQLSGILSYIESLK